MVTGTRSNVTPVGLRESTRPPVYRDKYSEGASGTLYTTYTEYKKRVAHGDAGGAIQREVVSVAELIPSHVQKCFARVYHESRTITPTQLVVAVENHAGHLDLTWPLIQHRRVERVQAVAAAKGSWSVCDPVLTLAGAAYGGS